MDPFKSLDGYVSPRLRHALNVLHNVHPMRWGSISIIRAGFDTDRKWMEDQFLRIPNVGRHTLSELLALVGYQEDRRHTLRFTEKETRAIWQVRAYLPASVKAKLAKTLGENEKKTGD